MDLQSYATILHHATILYLEYVIFFSKSPHALLLSVTSFMWFKDRDTTEVSCFCRLAFCSCFTQRKLCNTWSLVLGSLTCFHYHLSGLEFFLPRILHCVILLFFFIADQLVDLWGCFCF